MIFEAKTYGEDVALKEFLQRLCLAVAWQRVLARKEKPIRTARNSVEQRPSELDFPISSRTPKEKEGGGLGELKQE